MKVFTNLVLGQELELNFEGSDRDFEAGWFG